MSNDFLDDIKIIFFVVILGAVLAAIGLAFQNGWILGLGVLLAGAIPIVSLIMKVLEN